jgi:hypothetical protein
LNQEQGWAAGATPTHVADVEPFLRYHTPSHRGGDVFEAVARTPALFLESGNYSSFVGYLEPD